MWGMMMSEKRFTETERNCYYTSLVFDNQIQKGLGTNKVVELLNKLYGENKELKKDLNKLYNLLMDKGMSHNELQDVLWCNDE